MAGIPYSGRLPYDECCELISESPLCRNNSWKNWRSTRQQSKVPVYRNEISATANQILQKSYEPASELRGAQGAFVNPVCEFEALLKLNDVNNAFVSPPPMWNNRRYFKLCADGRPSF